MELLRTQIVHFQREILAFFEKYGRDLPWRHTTDPYRILVSEMMLQQTQVPRVIEKYNQFVTKFPNFSNLAQAPIHHVLAEWQGLGYNRRALYLKRCAEIVIQQYGSQLPTDPAILHTLPGIGMATAASICAFAFNLPVVFIETNIRRVYIHHFFANREQVADAEILPLVEASLYKQNPRKWYSALMDYGTSLAEQVPNPNRQSKHYTKQSQFAGSVRQMRGRIMRSLLRYGNVTKSDLEQLLQFDSRIEETLTQLEKEGFIAVDNEVYRVRS